ncbi:DUF3035 domain-containing protein [Tateyamaria pelophila]|uniref:DUF3035 domain-containing protein n=1 Tax=Tateyamaria pelophila TaxID=328415 RepID=UPI001CBB2957|nr:DUF3035 domain-containing protein [Tateyamaria pelophila]
MRIIACALIAVTFLAACENNGLRQVTSRGDGPDEFIVVPSKPLEEPTSFTALPAPTPGGINRTDQLPLQESVEKLGGQRGSPTAPIPARDAALVNRASRFGVDPGIRASLAEQDAEFRRRQSRLTQIRLFPEDLYNRAYRREALDPGRTAQIYRRAGVPTPTAPPR